MKTVELKIHGQVQGVFYRKETQQKATELGVFGFVKNNFDGTVTVVAQGKEETLQKLIEWCKKGPIEAEVTNVEVHFLENFSENFTGFEVRR